MIVTPSIVQDNFIGLDVKVIKSSNPDVVGIKGKIVDETRNTFIVTRDAKKTILVKETSIFDFVLPDKTVVEIDGKVIMGRPEERIKKRTRRLW